jgi:hypothetical protein
MPWQRSGTDWGVGSRSLGDPLPSGSADDAAERMAGRMHKVLRESRAPHLRLVLQAVAGGLKRLFPSAALDQAWLETARGPWLDEWGDALAIERLGGEIGDDEAYRQRLIARGVNRLGDTPADIAQAILEATGVSVAIVPGASLVARWDAWDYTHQGPNPSLTLGDGSTFTWNDPWGTKSWLGDSGYKGEFDPLDPLVGLIGSTQLYLEAGAYGPGGFIVFLPIGYDPEVEKLVVSVVARHLSAGSLFDLSWASIAGVPGRDGLGEYAWEVAECENALYGMKLPVLLPSEPIIHAAAVPAAGGFAWDDSVWDANPWPD